MDTSKEYVKMCMKAEEIQREWKISLGDFYFRYKEVPKPRAYIYFPPATAVDSIWLPRQDQLQEMLKEKIAAAQLSKIHKWYMNSKHYFKKLGSMSMEQLWLAFVMEERYNKTWNGVEWLS